MEEGWGGVERKQKDKKERKKERNWKKVKKVVI